MFFITYGSKASALKDIKNKDHPKKSEKNYTQYK